MWDYTLFILWANDYLHYKIQFFYKIWEIQLPPIFHFFLGAQLVHTSVKEVSIQYTIAKLYYFTYIEFNFFTLIECKNEHVKQVLSCEELTALYWVWPTIKAGGHSMILDHIC